MVPGTLTFAGNYQSLGTDVLGRERASGKGQLLDEPIESLFPLGGIVGVVGDMPEVGDLLLIEHGVESLANGKQSVPAAARKPQQFESPDSDRISKEVFGFLSVGG